MPSITASTFPDGVYRFQVDFDLSGTDYDFDEYLLHDIGYDKLSEILKGIMVSPYSATSLREYFATGFTDFYLHPDSHNYLKKTSPELYRKLVMLHRLEEA